MGRFVTSLLAVALSIGFLATGSANAFMRDTMVARQDTPSHVTLTATQKRPKSKYMRKKVWIETHERPGTIIIDTRTKFLYFIESKGRTTRYGVGVGREGFGWAGIVKVGCKAEWPDWRPPATIIDRERGKGRIIPTLCQGRHQQPAGGAGSLSAPRWPRYDLSNPRHQPALDHRSQHVFRLHPHDEQGRQAPLQAGSGRRLGDFHWSEQPQFDQILPREGRRRFRNALQQLGPGRHWGRTIGADRASECAWDEQPASRPSFVRGLNRHRRLLR